MLVTGFAQAEIRVLLIEGASNHDWERRISILESIVSRDGGISMDVTVPPADAGDPGWATWEPDFASYDVVISGYRGDNGSPDWPAAVKTALVGFVNGGGGLMVFHEALQGFPNWTEYQSMIGLSTEFGQPGTAVEIAGDGSLIFHAPGTGGATAHGAQTDSLVTRLGSHPIHAGLPVSWMAANLEVVRYPRGPAANLSILSYATDPDPPVGDPAQNWPIEWTVDYGTGRVYASTFGHIFDFEDEPEGMRCAAFQEIFVRAIKWLAGDVPPSTVPVDFPGTTETSLRPYSEGFAAFGGAVPVGPYADGVLPNSSIVPTGYEIVPAFPNLAWDSPIDARPWPGAPGELMVVEMDGRFYRVADDDATKTKQLVLDIQDRAWYMNWDSGSDPPDILAHKHGGVMSCAFHPLFGTGAGKDELYVFYLNHPTDSPGASPPYFQRVSRFFWDEMTGAFELDGGGPLPREEILIQQYDTVKGHDGGSLVFGPEGFLYITFGDEGTASEDAGPHVQKIDDRPRSGVWRIDVDETGGSVSHPIRRQPAKASPSHDSYTQNYYIPSDNPWVDAGFDPMIDPEADALEEFYAIGLREPHRMSYDSVEDRFWIGDVGANTIEEVDVLDGPSGTVGLNFQWRYKEGSITGFGSVPSPIIGTERGPVHEYDHGTGTCIIGGMVYRGVAMPELQGKYLFGDNGTQKIYSLEYDDTGGVVTEIAVEEVGTAREGVIWVGLSSFGVDSSGEPLVLQMGGGVTGGGLISRIQPAGTASTLEWEYPALLSETGLFTDLENLVPADSMIPYEVNAPLWSAGVSKKRWVMIPNDGVPSDASERITYSENQSWQFPFGTVFVKHFERPDDGAPLETRVMVHGVDGWGGVTYRWRPDGLEADLLEEGGEEMLTLEGETFPYLYPARNQCMLCHTTAAGSVLGFRTRQLNASIEYPSGLVGNQIEALSAAGFIEEVIKEEDLVGALTSAGFDDGSVDLTHRVRSYLDSNCSHCHQPSGSSRAFFDARLTTPLENQGILCGPVIESLGLDAPAVVKPGSLENSVLFQRVHSMDPSISMPPLAKGRIDDEAVVELAAWILGMTPDACTNAQSFYEGGAMGNVTSTGVAGSDAWQTNIVIDESSTYTNTSGAPIIVSLGDFQFEASVSGDPVTPFVVRVNGDNDFTVLAVGTSRSGYAIGANEYPFSDIADEVVLQPGEVLAAGFLDAIVDGSGGSGGEVVVWSDGGSEVWHGGGPDESDAGSVAVGLAPDPGGNLLTNQNRDYRFSIDYAVTSLQLGVGTEYPGFQAADGAPSNFVINLSDTFTNNTSETLKVSVDRFRFRTTRVTDPLTPFVVRVNGPDDFTVIAVGESQVVYAVGLNDVPFTGSTSLISVAPGETVAAGFVDSFADGSGGDSQGSMAYVEGGSTNYYRYHFPDHVGATLELGQAPIVPHPYGASQGPRSYLFSLSIGFGGNEDEDGDLLPDSWELVYVDDLSELGPGDSDGDGATDAEELEAGTDPTDRESRFEVIEVTPSPGEGAVVNFRSIPGRVYAISWSTDFGTWTDAGRVEASDWPAQSTQALIPSASLPGDPPQRLFVRVSTP
ncbi:hypothetical protein HAHE_37710 [Haloferula helveola]|uniref:Cytochrome c domain-containing protein n=1 Tax=Haloferula helveola TaxID=490095 RepID=A0ABN6H8Q3_9BACT|nr:hypothetical protein HAHE_37710 [Haloferula helveola]